MSRLFSLQNKVFLSMVVLVAGLVTATAAVVSVVVSREERATIEEDLRQARRVFEANQRETMGNIVAKLENLSEGPRLQAALDNKKDVVNTVADLVAEFHNNFSLFQVTDRKGRMLVTFIGTGGEPALGEPAAGATAYDAGFAAAVDPADPKVTEGAQVVERYLYLTVTGPVISANRVYGAVRGGLEVNATMAKELQRLTGSQIAFTIGAGLIVGSSLPPPAQNKLAQWLGGQPNLDAIAGDGYREPQIQEGTLDVPYLMQLDQLKDPQGRPVGYVVQLRSRAKILALLTKVRRGVLAIGLSGLVIATLFAFFLAAGITRPLKALVRGTVAVEQGRLDEQIKVSTRDELGALAESFNQMMADLKEKERVKAVFGRYLPKAVADRALAHQGELGLGGEEREVAILFSDVRGFTALSENVPPQELVAMLNDYFTRMVDVILEHDGTVDKYIGDAIMSLFGAPLADDQAPVKAVAAALGMMEALKAFNADRAARGKAQFEIGIGINTGVVVAGNLGSVKQLSYTVIGEEVNLASRLCSKAAKGQVLVSESVYRKTKWTFDYHRLEPITVKNVSYPVQVYEVAGRRAEGTEPKG